MVLVGVHERPLNNFHGRRGHAIFVKRGNLLQPILASLHLPTGAEPASAAVPARMPSTRSPTARPSTLRKVPKQLRAPADRH